MQTRRQVGALVQGVPTRAGLRRIESWRGPSAGSRVCDLRKAMSKSEIRGVPCFLSVGARGFAVMPATGKSAPFPGVAGQKCIGRAWLIGPGCEVACSFPG